jgi:hypothetical protein
MDEPIHDIALIKRSAHLAADAQIGMRPSCIVLMPERRFAGSTEMYVYAATDLQEFFIAFGRNGLDGAAIGYARFVRCGTEIINQTTQGLFELGEVLSASSPTPHPIVPLSGVLWTRRAALEADRAIGAYQAEGGQSLES